MINKSKINKDTYLLNDGQLCSSYVIIGSAKALIIDTGLEDDNNLLFEKRKLTSKEAIVVLTHGHFDHTAHVNEFDNFYVNKNDHVCFKDKELLKKAINVKHLQEFDIGNKKITAYLMPGHTKGSIIYIDEDNKALFTGDSFGSGCSVWMQVSEAIKLSKYAKNIKKFLKYLQRTYKDIPLSSWNLYGGHSGQEKTGKLGYNPLNMDMVINMAELSRLLIKKKVELQISNQKQFNNEQSYYACYKNAEMVVRKSLIK